MIRLANVRYVPIVSIDFYPRFDYSFSKKRNQRKEIRAFQKDIARIEKEGAMEVEYVVRASGLEEYNAKMRQIKEERKSKVKVKNRANPYFF